MWGIEALKADYDVALVTTAPVGPRELQELNAFYSTSLLPSEFSVVQAPMLSILRKSETPAALQGAFFQRYCQRIARQFDVLVSAYNPCDFGVPAIQLVADFSWDHELLRQFDPAPRRWQLIPRDGRLHRAYLTACRWFSAPSGRDLFHGEDLLITNSQWTSRVLSDRRGVRGARIIYPPVITDFQPAPWEQREPGFVCIGRVRYEKRLETIIEILGAVRSAGHDVRLHLLGRIDHSHYGRTIRALCRRNAEWIEFEGTKTGAEKSALLSRQRFGIHARPYEPFGIAVAEMVAAGCIPFVPDNGGLVEIVEEPELRYRDPSDAVAKIDAVLRDPQRQRQLAAGLAQRAGRFSTERFMREFRAAVDEFARRRAGGRS